MLEMGDLDLKNLELSVAKRIGASSVRLERNATPSLASETYCGLASDSRRIFVKVASAESLVRSRKVHAVCADLDFIPKVLDDGPIDVEGKDVLVTEWIVGCPGEPIEFMSERRFHSLFDGYLEFSRRIQVLRSVATHQNQSDVSALELETVNRYCRGGWLRKKLLRDLGDISMSDVTLDVGRLSVVHNDFHQLNYVFRGDALAAIFDFDSLSLGLPCEDICAALAVRNRSSRLSERQREKLCARTREAFSLCGYSQDDWRLMVNRQRIRCAAQICQGNSCFRLLKLLRRDRRSLQALLWIMDKTNRDERYA